MVDAIPRLVMQDFDYKVLSLVDDDVLLIEWDLAVSREHLQSFAKKASEQPDRILVAPYLLYNPHGTVWAHRRYTALGQKRYVVEGEPTCHQFGLGLTYLPRELVRAFLDDYPGPFTDSTFSGWHYRNAPNPEVEIDWSCRPIHLHYELPEELT